MRWCLSELAIAEMLSDPVTKALMAADRVAPEELQPNLRKLLQRIDSIKQFLQIQEFDLPRALLPLDDTLQSIGCVAMSTTGIKEYDRQLAHQSSQPSAFTQVLSGDC